MPKSDQATSFLSKHSAQEVAMLAMSTPFEFGNEELAKYGCGLATDKFAYNWAAVIVLALRKYLNKKIEYDGFEHLIDEAIYHVDRYAQQTKSGGMYKQSEIGLIKERFWSRELSARAPTNQAISLAVNNATSKLEKEGYIKDPFVETFGGLPLMILGVILFHSRDGQKKAIKFTLKYLHCCGSWSIVKVARTLNSIFN